MSPYENSTHLALRKSAFIFPITIPPYTLKISTDPYHNLIFITSRDPLTKYSELSVISNVFTAPPAQYVPNLSPVSDTQQFILPS